MSIENRLRDARFLYDDGRFDGALLMVLVAAAGTSRLRYSRSAIPSDKDAFEKFMGDERAKVGQCQVFVQSAGHPVEHFFYKWLRCELIHEATLPEEIVFRPSAAPNSAGIHWDCSGLPGKIIVDHPMVLLIGSVVASAAENSSLPASVRQSFAPT